MPEAFKLFDAHVHVGRWKTPDFAGHQSDLASVCGVLASCGITGALVMPTDDGNNVGLARGVAASGGESRLKLMMAAWVDPHDPDATMEFLEGHHPMVSALKLHPSFARLPITDQAYRPFFEFAAQSGLPIVTHCGRWREVAGWERALEMAESFPDVPIVLSHMGGDSPTLVAGASNAIKERKLNNAYLGTESIREPWVVGRAIDTLGADRLIFGSDHNLNHPNSFIAVINALGLSNEEKAQIFWKNAQRLLRYDEGRRDHSNDNAAISAISNKLGAE